MISIIIPGYLIVVMAGWKRALEVLPAIIACGVSFAGMQFYVSNYVGPELTDILSSLTCIVVMVLVLKFWKPKTILRLEGDKPIAAALTRHSRRRAVHGVGAVPPARRVRAAVGRRRHQARDQPLDRQPAAGVSAGMPSRSRRSLNRLLVPGLHNLITQMPPVTAQPAPYARRLRVQLAERLRHGLLARRRRDRDPAARAARRAS